MHFCKFVIVYDKIYELQDLTIYSNIDSLSFLYWVIHFSDEQQIIKAMYNGQPVSIRHIKTYVELTQADMIHMKMVNIPI